MIFFFITLIMFLFMFYLYNKLLGERLKEIKGKKMTTMCEKCKKQIHHPQELKCFKGKIAPLQHTKQEVFLCHICTNEFIQYISDVCHKDGPAIYELAEILLDFLNATT